MDNEPENEIKMILLGDCGVGKTNIISRYLKDTFTESQLTTTGGNYAIKKINFNGKNFYINIWDTAGQEKFRSVTKMFLQDSQIILLCYSIVDRKSFDNLDYWLNLATEITGKNIVVGIAGNKSDLFEEEQVKEEEGENYAKKFKAIFKLISAKTNKEGIDKLFESLFEKYINAKSGNDSFSATNIINIKYNKKKEKKKKWC